MPHLSVLPRQIQPLKFGTCRWDIIHDGGIFSLSVGLNIKQNKLVLKEGLNMKKNKLIFKHSLIKSYLMQS
jgi:hypothetical protein